MSLAGRVALVTARVAVWPAASPALALAEDSADVAINYRRDADAAAKWLRLLKLRPRAVHIKRRWTISEQDREMVDHIEADLGPIGILINNAGIAAAARRSPTPIRPRCSASWRAMRSRRTICRSW
jgi:NAD(P)-dependent dehydrogenase (short-subunit alcohol dehydrogenase family)